MLIVPLFDAFVWWLHDMLKMKEWNGVEGEGVGGEGVEDEDVENASPWVRVNRWPVGRRSKRR
jgi:hypothetical protein